MNTHFEFVSPGFPEQIGEDLEANPGRFGRALAEFLAMKVRADGYRPSDPIPESWGWSITFPNPDFRLWLGCGVRDDVENGWLVFVEPYISRIRKLFRKIETPPIVEPLISAAYAAIEAHPETTDLRWWTDADMKLSGV